MKNMIKKILWGNCGLLLVVILGLTLSISPIKVQGQSMENTYLDGQELWGLNYQLHNPWNHQAFGPRLFSIKRNDVVVIQSQRPERNKHYLIKRVIGLPQQLVTIKEDAVWINQRPLTEVYRQNHTYYDNYWGQQINSHPAYVLKQPMVRNNTDHDQPASWQLNAQQFFAMGDNRNYSTDSRIYGPFNLKDIQAKILPISLSLRLVQLCLFGLLAGNLLAIIIKK